ncbi:hypothetical protein [Halobacterium zhouii]|uniref:hypothetical protein n=1 Tax=Halobacterium zhouii TaxID=2902624 RepID=UPI001E37B565|nr:hypothetical protein [Halobacterium zhouii]
MRVRDAVDEDADVLVTLTDDDVDADRLIRDRTVQVAEMDSEVVGFLAFDTWRDTVHVTRLGGDPDAVEELLGAPCSFAERESLPVEVVLLDTDEPLHDVVVRAGFDEVGPGPMFDGERTRRYRHVPTAE